MSLEDKKRRLERKVDPFNTNTVFEIRREFLEGKKKELQELKREVQLTELRGKVGAGQQGKQEKQGTGGLDALTAKSKMTAEQQIKQEKQKEASQKSQGQTEQGRASP